MTETPDNATRTARELARRTGVDHHDVLVILGTGLASVAERLGAAGPSIPLATLPFFPRYTATGHHAQGWSVPIGGKMVLVFAGRCHAYEGIELTDVVHPLRTGIAAGCSTVILTAAVGGIRRGSAHRFDRRRLRPPEPHRPFPFGGSRIRRHGGCVFARAARPCPLCGGLGRGCPRISTGVYAHVLGPQFETPAEIRMMRTLGADVVGMSMAFETIAARHAGADVLGLAVVTNDAAGTVSDEPVADLGHIGAAGLAAAPTVADIIRHVIVSLP